jgi:hypothetical protein
MKRENWPSPKPVELAIFLPLKKLTHRRELPHGGYGSNLQ